MCVFALQLIVPSDSAHDTVAALGDTGLLQFKDLNTEKSAFQRNYANQVGTTVLAHTHADLNRATPSHHPLQLARQ